MPRVFAGFYERFVDTKRSVQIRRDTRFYLADQDRIGRDFGRCIGAFYLINPGCADPTTQPTSDANGLRTWRWGPLRYNAEALLPHLSGVLADALDWVRARDARFHRDLVADGYVQILNLSYVRSVKESGLAVSTWRTLLHRRAVTEDIPRAASTMQFVVFGWGGFYRPTFDGRRIANALASFLPTGCRLLFPTMDAVQSGRRITRRHVRRQDADWLRPHLSLTNHYPCGAQAGRAAYCRRYRRVMGRELGRALLEGA